MTAWKSSSEDPAGEAGTGPPWSREEFESRLRALGRYYHLHHPFQQMMAGGELDRAQLQGWVINRFYYQINIPRKDAAVLANCPDREVRRQWVQRILDHDGRDDDAGGIEAWLRLGEAVGVARERMLSLEEVLPGVRFAVDAYVNFARQRPWEEAVCSSLTELFAPEAHRSRLATWPEHYPWVDPDGLAYFRSRLSQAGRDVEHGLALTLAHFRSAEGQRRALEILRFKLDVLWSMLDAMYLAYVVGMPPYQAAEEGA
ncbi:pyrroloquinoline-quinone synthase PqqC [Arhodomonas sp. SL1]|uniref:pyrroloquinoline-quinone synthase PqqC n=1 Tax=Arhodomonas sp. SL1 TaxID=3425691 RepID=UPI003F88596D